MLKEWDCGCTHALELTVAPVPWHSLAVTSVTKCPVLWERLYGGVPFTRPWSAFGWLFGLRPFCTDQGPNIPLSDDLEIRVALMRSELCCEFHSWSSNTIVLITAHFCKCIFLGTCCSHISFHSNNVYFKKGNMRTALSLCILQPHFSEARISMISPQQPLILSNGFYSSSVLSSFSQNQIVNEFV